MEGIEPYFSNQAYCGVCMKTAVDAMMVPNTHTDFFTAVQVCPAPVWLCVWCRARLRGFAALRDKARRARYLLTVIHNLTLDPFLETRICVESEIVQLKREALVTELVSVTDLVSPEPEYVEVKVEEGRDVRRKGRRGRRREEKQPIAETERVEIKLYPADDDDDSWDMVPLKLLKDEGETSPGVLTDHDETKTYPITETANTVTEEPQLETSKSSKQATRKPRTKRPTNALKRKREEIAELVEPKAWDMSAAIEELDNESYIVSEEVHRHVETVALSEAGDKQRAFRTKKPSYLHAAHRCEACALGFPTHDQYQAHMHNHSPSAGSHRCHPCAMYFEKHRELERHVQSHYRRHRCRLCPHASTDYRAAVKHYISQHSRVSFTCWHCNKEFRRPINLKKHMQKVHKKETEAGCAVCGDEFRDAAQLRQHMQSHKPEEIAWHECPICKKKSRNKYNMVQHIRAHDKESLPIVCDLCRKTFKTNVLLTTHVQRLHTENSKKYQCDECGKFFYDKGELRIHVQWTHKREGGVECGQCARKFRTAYLLNDHVQRVHHNIPKPKDKLCDFCGRGFSSRKSLKSHRYIHTGERPHACPDCGQTFRQRCAMRLHYKSKHLHMRWKELVAKKKKPA